MPDDFIDVTFKTCVVYHVFIAGAFGPSNSEPRHRGTEQHRHPEECRCVMWHTSRDYKFQQVTRYTLVLPVKLQDRSLSHWLGLKFVIFYVILALQRGVVLWYSRAFCWSLWPLHCTFTCTAAAAKKKKKKKKMRTFLFQKCFPCIIISAIWPCFPL